MRSGNWTLKINGGDATFADLRAASATLEFRSLACDFLRVSSQKEFDFGEGDHIELFYGSARKFKGECASIKTSLSAQKISREAVFKNAWADLEKIPYTQDWQTLSDGAQATSAQTSSRVILGQNQSGEKISAAAQIQDIVACANARGANILLSPLSIAAQIPADETADLSCAQAILRVLKWLPDVVSHFDYSAQTPALVFQRRADLQTFDISSLAIKSMSFKKRRDLKIESVCVNYEKTNTLDGSNFKAIARDVYPQNAAVGGKNSLMLTVPLGGYSQKTQHQKVETLEIQTASQSWWRGKIQFLNNPAISSFTVRNIARTSTLPRELLSGNIMDWMLCSLERDTISADIEYFIGEDSAGVESVKISLLATNARTTTYSRTLSTAAEEPQPIGLAQAIYEASNVPQTEGACEISNAGGECAVCKKIAYKNELENACVVESRIDLFRNSLKVKFGPPKHLYPDDISELFRTAAIRKVPQNPQIRLTGESSKDNVFKYSESVYAPQVARFTKDCHKLEVKNPQDGTVAVSIDPLDIGEDDDAGVVSLQKMLIVENGEPRYAYFLMSEPFETE